MTDVPNPLLSELRALAANGPLTQGQFYDFFGRALANADNLRVEGATSGVLYSGSTLTPDGQRVYNGAIATDLAARSGGQVAAIDNTNVGRLLAHVAEFDVVESLVDPNVAITNGAYRSPARDRSARQAARTLLATHERTA